MRIMVAEHAVIHIVFLAGKYPVQKRIRRNDNHRILPDIRSHASDRRNLVARGVAEHPVKRIGDIIVELLVKQRAQAVTHAVTVSVEHPAARRIRHRRLFQIDVLPRERIANRRAANGKRAVHHVGRTHHVKVREPGSVRLYLGHGLVILVEEHERIRSR